MEKVFLYSDETAHKGHAPIFVVAGVAVEGYHTAIWKELLRIEDESGKDGSDWHRTKDVARRQRYLQGALKIEALRGRIFYEPHHNTNDTWLNTVQTLRRAVTRFGNDKRCIVAHEGFTRAARERLKYDIRRVHATRQFEIAPGNLEHNPFVRLADALAGFVGLSQRNPNGADRIGRFPDEWFVDLSRT